MKIKILLILVFLVSLSTKAQLTATDDGCFIFVESPTLQKIHLDKSRMSLQKTTTKVFLIYTSNNTPFSFSWDIPQATAYMGGLDQLYTYLAGILASGCGVAPPIPSPNAGDTMLSNKIDSLINVSNGILTATKKLDSTHIDTSLIQHIQLQQIIDSLSVLINDSTYSLILNKIYSQILRLDTSQIDTSLDKSIIDNDFDSVLVLNDSIKVYFTQPIEAKDTTHQTILNEINSVLNNINQRIDTTQQDTSFINYFTEWNRNNDTLSSILQELKTLDSVYVVNRDTAVVSVVGMKDTLFTYDLDTSVVLTIDSTYYFQLDSIIKLLQKDTMQFEYHSFCYRSKADSGVYEFSQIFNVTNPLVPIFMSFVDIDSLTLLYSLVNGVSVGTIPNFATDYVPCERWNEYLSSTKQDTLKTLVFKAQTKRIDGTLDTLYNCKGLSFSVSDNATGNITFYYGNGDQDVFDVANEQLPFWENGSFVEFIGFDASSVAGVLRVNMLGCSQTPDVICAKEKPIVNCTTSTPIIICSGWGSLSGIWSTISGCWNTGQ